MTKWLALLFIAVPALEIWGIVLVGNHMGAFPTLFMLLLTGLAGAYLAKREGRRAWTEASRQMQAGQLPGQTLLDGLCIVIGAVLLMTPGFLSDLLGLTLLLPVTRPLYRGLLLRWLEKRMRGGGPFTIRRF